MAATERIPVMVTAKEKAQLFKKAKQANITVSEMLRRAAEDYDPVREEKSLLLLMAEAVRSTEAAMAAVDDSEKFCVESNARIAEMEEAHAARRK
jgi:hypothetical protein